MAENNPPLPIVANQVVMQVDLVGDLFGQRTLNRLYLMSPGPTDPIPAGGAFANAVWDNIKAAWTAAVSADWALQGIITRPVHVYGLVPTVTLRTGLVAPLDGVRGASCPPQDAVVIKRVTSLIGKRARGRIYVAGVAEEDHSSGELTLFGRANFDGLAFQLTAGVNVAGVNYQPSQVYWRHTPPNTVEVRGQVIFQQLADRFIRSQRRRQIGRGQ